MVTVRRRRGVTLTEIMIAIAILGIIGSMGPSILTSITRFSRLSRARLETQEAARNTLQTVNQALRQASASTVVVSNEASQPPFSSIRFSTVDGRNIMFYQLGDSLKFVQGSSTSTIANDGLRYIAFTYPRTDDSQIISVSVTFEKATYQGGTKALQMAIEKVRIMND